jgi:hypothetical protein
LGALRVLGSSVVKNLLARLTVRSLFAIAEEAIIFVENAIRQAKNNDPCASSVLFFGNGQYIKRGLLIHFAQSITLSHTELQARAFSQKIKSFKRSHMYPGPSLGFQRRAH